jgi:ubiquinone/menaquinone biosynthesis C-methylase UbiE
VKAYYERRAPEYDDWWLGRGRFADVERLGWDDEVAVLRSVISALPPRRTLDVACGTGFLTRHLRGDVTGLDQSPTMVAIARRQAPRATFVLGDGLALPFPDGSFERVFTSYFYCHLEEHDRVRFLAEARRVAPELVVVATPRRDRTVTDEWQERVLTDGSRWTVFKRLFDPEALADELGGGELLHVGHYFVVARLAAA